MDGPDFFELNRFVNRFGICDREYTNTKVLSISLSNKEYSMWGRYLKMKLVVDYNRKKIFILVTNVNGKIIEKKSYWNFDSIKEIVERKLNYLCFVQADIIYSKLVKYVHYDTMSFYKFKNFNTFLRLLNEGTITICIKCGVYKNGNKKGQRFDHGTAFLLQKDKLSELFEIMDIN